MGKCAIICVKQVDILMYLLYTKLTVFMTDDSNILSYACPPAEEIYGRSDIPSAEVLI